MSGHFVLTVHLYDRRFHGADEWPPAPARVFQALVAGAARGRQIPDRLTRALTLLEALPPPVIAAPTARRGQRVALFVPNNDLDAKDGDPGRVSEVRAKKTVQPWLIEGDTPFLYAWPLPDDADGGLGELADGLYQLGRGIDPAWSTGEYLDEEQLASCLRTYRGTIHRPTPGEGERELATPTTHSFLSISRRFDAALARLRPSGDGRTNFVQPPKAHFVMVRYDGTPSFRLLELRRESEPGRPAPWAAWRGPSLVERVRDVAVAALSGALPERREEIERVLVGRRRDGSNAGATEQRVRFIPLPSIGHEHADQSIRRVLVQVPPGPLAEGDVLWALTGRQLIESTTGDSSDTVVVSAVEDEMVRRYRSPSRTWRSVTPLVLGTAPRRRIEPSQQLEEAKPARERDAEERKARHAVAQALRHARVEAELVQLQVQREPWDSNGTRAERFAEGTRFAKEALWHVEIELDREVGGPLVLGDGRFLGLGVMVPTTKQRVYALEVEGGLPEDVDSGALARALRRAVMARAQAVLSARRESDLPAYFHGHAPDGKPAREDRSTHLAFTVDAPRSRLLIVPPHVLDGLARPSRAEATHQHALERALQGFTTLRAGRVGVLSLRLSVMGPCDPLLRSSRTFCSVSDYVVGRHAKRTSAEEVVKLDVIQECTRRRLPRPVEVIVTGVRGVAQCGVVARVQLAFAVSQRGPLLLGRTRYLGGGLFRPSKDDRR